MAWQTSSRQVNGHVVFQARIALQTAVLDEFAVLENSYTDDELVYAVSPELNPPESSTVLMPRTQVSPLARASTESTVRLLYTPTMRPTFHRLQVWELIY
jgi:hypothetical protein